MVITRIRFSGRKSRSVHICFNRSDLGLLGLDSQSVWFCLILEPGFLLFCGAGLIFEVLNPAAGKMFTLLDFRPENRILVMTISTVSMRQNPSI